MVEIEILTEEVKLVGLLEVPQGAKSLILFVHGSGSSRFSPRNNYVSRVLNEAGLATFQLDLLTEGEDAVYENRFDIDLLTKRLKAVTGWCQTNSETAQLSIGYFGASTGTAAALRAAAILRQGSGVASGEGPIRAIVSRGGRPDLASDEDLMKVKAPTLLIVGGNDAPVIEMNQSAYKKLGGVHKIEVVPGATHLFEEPGALEKVAELAADWFKHYLEEK